jgi:peptide/nickel transport system permease protein
MRRFILIRLVHSLIALWIISVVVFLLIHISGSPADAGLLPEDASREVVEELEAYWGVNDPLHEQYFGYMSNILRGDFGQSIRWEGVSSAELIAQRFPATLQLAGIALVISVIIAVPIGVLSAVKKDTPADYTGKIVALLGQSVPGFWLAIVLIWIFAVNLDWFPTSGRGGIRHIILPAITLGIFPVAAIMRLVRSSMLEVLDSEYVKLARIKGIREWKVIWKHCLRNAAISPLTYFAVVSASVLTGSVITETVFFWPGLGQMALLAVQGRDYFVVQTVLLFFATLYIGANLIADILYAYLDPRIRYS